MYTIGRENRILYFSKDNKPVMKVDEKDAIEFVTVDCYSNKWQEGIDLTTHKMGSGNPGIGPVYINNALPGDVLKVEVVKVKVDNEGVMLSVPGFGYLSEKLTGPEGRIIPIKNNKAMFNDKIHIPINPMIGLIGVAPPGEGIRSTLPGAHGGNLDNKMITEGVSVYFPVFAQGALLALGDLHAVQGDGEVGFNGIEISGSVTVKTQILKDLKIKEPVLTNDRYLSTISSAKTLDEACDNSIRYMIDFFLCYTDIKPHELNMLISLVGEVQVCQCVSPLKTARFLIPNWVLEKYEFKAPFYGKQD